MAANGSSDVTPALVAAGGVSARLIEAYRSILTDTAVDGSTAAITLALPSVSEMVQNIHEADPTVVYAVRSFVRKSIGQLLMHELREVRPNAILCLHVTLYCRAANVFASRASLLGFGGAFC